MFDVWTGSDRCNYMTVSIHYLTNQWNRESWVLGSDRMSFKPSCSELSMCIRSLLSQYQLSLESITAVINRQGMLKGAQIGKVGSSLLCDSMSCAAEKLEQCVQIGLQAPRIKEIVDDVAKMIAHLLQNDEARDLMQKTKQEAKINIELEDSYVGAWLAITYMLIKVRIFDVCSYKAVALHCISI